MQQQMTPEHSMDIHPGMRIGEFMIRERTPTRLVMAHPPSLRFILPLIAMLALLTWAFFFAEREPGYEGPSWWGIVIFALLLLAALSYFFVKIVVEPRRIVIDSQQQQVQVSGFGKWSAAFDEVQGVAYDINLDAYENERAARECTISLVTTSGERLLMHYYVQSETLTGRELVPAEAFIGDASFIAGRIAAMIGVAATARHIERREVPVVVDDES